MAAPDPAAPLPRPARDVAFQRVPDGGVLYAAATETYFGLNRVGVEAWELLPPATSTFGELADRLSERHPDADRATVLADVGELLEELLRHGLVTSAGASDAGPGRSAGDRTAR